MKKQALILSLSLIFIIGSRFTSNAQLIYEKDKHNPYWYYDYSSPKSNYNVFTYGGRIANPIKNNKDNNIKSNDYTKFKVKKKGKRLVENTRGINYYNKNGNILDRVVFKHGKEKQHYSIKYNDNNLFVDFKKHVRGKYKIHEKINYDNNDNVLEYNLEKRNKFETRFIASYKDSLIILQKEYDKDTTEISRKWEYDYYQTAEKKETRYFKDNKLKHKWSYTCDEEGKEIKPKNETTVCELKQYNADSTYVLIRRFTGKKGRITKSRITFDKKDRVILREFINKNDKIFSKEQYVYDSNDNKIARYKYYNGKKSDQIRWGYEYKYNNNKKVTEQKYLGKNKKIRNIRTYTFNNAGKMTSSIKKKADGSLISKSEYIYNDKNLIKESLIYNKKNKLVSKTINSYDYF